MGTTSPRTDRPPVVVVGAGLAGLGVAWRLAQRGRPVVCLGSAPHRAASQVAAGMLAPVTESSFTETPLLRLNLDARDRWPGFAAELEAASGLPSGFHDTPTLSVALGPDDAARLRDLAGWLSDHGQPCELLSGRRLRGHEPLLAPGIRSGLLVERDWSCDNRLLHGALRTAAERAGAELVRGTVSAVETVDTQVVAVRTEDGTRLVTDQVVVASGAWAGGHELGFELPVRPVKGQVLRLTPHRAPRLRHTVRAFADGSEVYLVPRDHGELVVGATVEELGFDDRVTAGGVYELLRDARRVVPVTAEYELSQTQVGWRPATPDHAPLLGPTPVAGLSLAAGLYRNGVLLTPLVAEVVAGWVLEGRLAEVAEPFRLQRLAG